MWGWGRFQPAPASTSARHITCAHRGRCPSTPKTGAAATSCPTQRCCVWILHEARHRMYGLFTFLFWRRGDGARLMMYAEHNKPSPHSTPSRTTPDFHFPFRPRAMHFYHNLRQRRSQNISCYFQNMAKFFVSVKMYSQRQMDKWILIPDTLVIISRVR